MKHLKNLCYLIFALTIIISCEKEENALLENTKIDQKQELLQRREVSSNWFFWNPEQFGCTNLPIQNFAATNYGGSFAAPIDEYTNTLQFSTGDILPGISFDVLNTINPNAALFIPSNSYGYPNILMSSYSTGSLVVYFTNNDVKDVSMRLFDQQTSDMIVTISGEDDHFIAQTQVTYTHPDDRAVGKFMGFHSDESIKKIIITSNYGFEGIDMISFGNCSDPDLDDDGILNEDDPFPESNVNEMLSIGENNLDIENVFVEEGTTMMDQIDALIAEINEKYDGSNYSALHREFIREISKITYYWTKDRLITRSERSAISSAAWSANIPYLNQLG